MKVIKNIQGLFTKSEFMKLVSKGYEILDYIDLGSDEAGLFVNYIDPSKLHKESKTSICIASAVTSYARVHMSKFKNNPDYNLYYTDTDSIYIDSPLPDIFISDTELGKFKLEYILDKAIFLGPKIYAGITDKGKYICKVKGFKNSSSIPFSDMESLLYKDQTLELSHVKWFKSLVDGDITLKKQVYDLQKTANKRAIIFDANYKAIDTKAYTINSNK